MVTYTAQNTSSDPLLSIRAASKAVPAVWLDGHLDIIQPFLSAPGWFSGTELTTQREHFDAAFAEYAREADRMLLPGGGGMLPSGRHYPGYFDDRPKIDS